MAKGSGRRVVYWDPFFFWPDHAGMQEKESEMKNAKREKKQDVIAVRKTCDAKGTGLSHFILMDKKAEK